MMKRENLMQVRGTSSSPSATETGWGFVVCMQSSKIANRARWTRSLRVSLGGVGEAVLVEAEVDRRHALCSMRSVPIWNDFG